MTEVETISKEATFELTAEQQKHVTRIQNSLTQHGIALMGQIEESLKSRVKYACEDMGRLGILKHRISYFVC